MTEGTTPEVGIIAGDKNDAPEAMVLSRERWEEVRRLQREEGLKVSKSGTPTPPPSPPPESAPPPSGACP